MMYLNEEVSSIVSLSTVSDIFRKATVISKVFYQKRHPQEVRGKDPVN